MRPCHHIAFTFAITFIVGATLGACKTPMQSWTSSLAHELPTSSGVAAPSVSPASVNAVDRGPLVEALTTPSAGGGVLLFVYAEQAAKEIDILTADGWHPLPYVYTAQTPRWTTIRSIYASEAWTQGERVRVRLTMPDGTTSEVDAPVEHR